MDYVFHCDIYAEQSDDLVHLKAEELKVLEHESKDDAEDEVKTKFSRLHGYKLIDLYCLCSLVPSPFLLLLKGLGTRLVLMLPVLYSSGSIAIMLCTWLKCRLS